MIRNDVEQRKRTLTSIGVRCGPWKVVRYRKDRNDGPDWRLYDLRDDIGELNDVASEHPEQLQQILGLLKRDELALVTAPKKK